MSKLTKQERLILNSLDYELLVKDAKIYHGKPFILIIDVYKYYITLPGHVEVEYPNFICYIKKFYDVSKLCPELHEPYTGKNKTILYYLDLLSK